jgi:hypothetical protein
MLAVYKISRLKYNGKTDSLSAGGLRLSVHQNPGDSCHAQRND